MNGDRPPARLPAPVPGVAYRLSDVERDEAISALADAYAEGRLDVEEFQQRMEAASRARFAVDLDPLFEDLPHRPVTRPVEHGRELRGQVRHPQRRSSTGELRRRRSRGATWMALTVVLILALAIATHVWLLLPLLFILTRRAHHRAARLSSASGGHACMRQGRGW